MPEEKEVVSNYLNGVFYFSNNSKEDFTPLWNNKEYTFPAMTCSPIIIPTESPENIQEIRKKWAFKWAEREWYNGKEYKRLSKMGQGLPPTRDNKVLEPLIQMCLTPLPVGSVIVKDAPKKKENFKGSKAVGKKDNLNEIFKDEPILEIGELRA